MVRKGRSRPTARRYAWVTVTGGTFFVSLSEYHGLWLAADAAHREINPPPPGDSPPRIAEESRS